MTVENYIARLKRNLLNRLSLNLEDLSYGIGTSFLLAEAITEKDSEPLILPVTLTSIETFSEICNNTTIEVDAYIFVINRPNYSVLDNAGKLSTDYRKLWWLFEPTSVIKNFFSYDDLYK